MIELEEGKHYKLPHGATIFVASHEFKDHKLDGILYQPVKGNTTVHVYSPHKETDSDIHVYFNDNLCVDMKGFRKDNPTYKVYKDEWPCKLILEESRV